MSDPTRNSLKINIVKDGVEIRFGLAAADRETLPIDALPILVEQLLKAGRPVQAISISNAWFVALANSYGYEQYVLDGGRK